MSKKSSRSKRLPRSLAFLFLALGLGLANVAPAAALEAGVGVATGTEVQIDSSDPTPVSGTADSVAFMLCARAQDNDFSPADTDSLSAQYTVAGTGTFTAGTGAVYAGPVTIDVKATATFFYGPQGTHHGKTAANNDCGADNLGPLAPVPATVTISGGSNFSCTDTGGDFWRAAGNVFVIDMSVGSTSTCSVTGNVIGASGSGTTTSNVTFVGNFQPPCGLPVDCITGAYTQL